MRSAVVALLVLLVVVPGAAAQPAGDVGTETTTVDIDVHSGGDATFNVTARFRLETDNETTAFRRMAEEFESGGTGGFSADPFREMAARAENRTNRSMAIEGERRSSRVVEHNGSRVGLLSLEFRWVNFGRTDDQQLVVGDAFDAWQIESGQVVRIYPPEGHGVDSATPPSASGVEQGVVTWEGPQSFGDGEPAIAYIPGARETPSGPGDDGFGTAVQIGAALLVGGVLVYGWTRRERLLAALAAEGSDDEKPDQEPPVEERDASDGSASGASGVSDGADETEQGTSEGSPPPIDDELLSDEEYVERLLERHDGRMKQATIVEETDWSNAKVSQLLSSMAEDGRIEKLRIGRENLITLVDEEG